MQVQTESRPAPGPPAGNHTILEFEKPLVRIEREVGELETVQRETGRDLSSDIRAMRARLVSMTKRTYSNLTPGEVVQVARHPRRPLLPHYLDAIVRDFCELHGDRAFRDDRAIVTGFGRIAGQKVMLIGHNKGRDTKEKIVCNFGCAHPEGYRKALRAVKLAAKFHLPVVSLIDTQGAYPGIGAEERGIAQAIAVNLMELSRVATPIVCVVIGEGGSGGALGIGVGDRVLMLEHSFYSVISPEGCAAILWKTGEHAKRAAECLKLTARELKKLNVIDEIIPEPLGGAHRDPTAAAAAVERAVGQTLRELKRLRPDTLLKRRYERLRNLGSFFTSASAGEVRPMKAPAKKAGRTPELKPRAVLSRAGRTPTPRLTAT